MNKLDFVVFCIACFGVVLSVIAFVLSSYQLYVFYMCLSIVLITINGLSAYLLWKDTHKTNYEHR